MREEGEMAMNINGYGVFLGGCRWGEKVTVVMVAQFCEHTKNH